MNWVEDAVSGAVGDVLEMLVDAVQEAVMWVSKEVASVFVEAGTPHFGADMLDVQGGIVWLALVAVIGSVTAAVGIAVVKPAGNSLADTLTELPFSVVMVLSCFSVMSIWLRFTQALTNWILTDTIKETFAAGMEFDTSIVPWVRFVLGVLLVLFFILFL
ncbi:MAG: hypothetical protein ABMA25_29200, partial [Ilumatobacteraceae bacterium]